MYFAYMELYQIKHFIAVAEAGGFAKGAERVAVSQPAISASIVKLEAELSVKLLERRHSQVVPTRRKALSRGEQGHFAFLQCGQIRTSNNGGRNASENWGDASTFQQAYFLPAEFLPAANPHIRIEVADGHCDGWCRCDRLFGPLAEGERDAVLSIVNDRVAVKFASQVLFEVPYMLAVPADHRFAQQQAVSVGELANEPLILPEYCGFLQDVGLGLALCLANLRSPM